MTSVVGQADPKMVDAEKGNNAELDQNAENAVQGQDAELTRLDTQARMDKKKAEAFGLPISWVFTGICCFWLPLCCFLAAANALPSCQKLGALIGEDQSLASFIKEYSLIMILTGPVIQLAVTCAAASGNKFAFKFAESLHFITGCFQLGLMIRGWMHYANTTDEACYDGDGDPSLDHYINPRQMLFGILLFQTIMIGLLCICIPIAVLAVLKKASSEA